MQSPVWMRHLFDCMIALPKSQEQVNPIQWLLMKVRIDKQGMALTAIVAIALTFFAVRAQTQAAESSGYQAIADKFFALLEQGKSEEAIDYAFSTNLALKNLPGKSEQLKAQFGQIEKQLGSYHSHAKLAETKVAGMFVLTSIISLLTTCSQFPSA